MLWNHWPRATLRRKPPWTEHHWPPATSEPLARKPSANRPVVFRFQAQRPNSQRSHWPAATSEPLARKPSVNRPVVFRFEVSGLTAKQAIGLQPPWNPWPGSHRPIGQWFSGSRFSGLTAKQAIGLRPPPERLDTSRVTIGPPFSVYYLNTVHPAADRSGAGT